MQREGLGERVLITSNALAGGWTCIALAIRKATPILNVQFQLIYAFSELYLANVKSADWVGGMHMWIFVIE